MFCQVQHTTWQAGYSTEQQILWHSPLTHFRFCSCADTEIKKKKRDYSPNTLLQKYCKVITSWGFVAGVLSLSPLCSLQYASYLWVEMVINRYFAIFRMLPWQLSPFLLFLTFTFSKTVTCMILLFSFILQPSVAAFLLLFLSYLSPLLRMFVFFYCCISVLLCGWFFKKHIFLKLFMKPIFLS